MIKSELIVEYEGQYHFATMVRWKQYKLISYHGMEPFELLFDLQKDPGETKNLIGSLPEAEIWLRSFLPDSEESSGFEHRQVLHDRNAKLYRAYEVHVPTDESEHWGGASESAKLKPSIH